MLLFFILFLAFTVKPSNLNKKVILQPRSDGFVGTNQQIEKKKEFIKQVFQATDNDYLATREFLKYGMRNTKNIYPIKSVLAENEQSKVAEVYLIKR